MCKSYLTCAKNALIGALSMWIIGSILSQFVLYSFSPQDYPKGWPFYLFMTLVVSAVGVFTFGMGSLIMIEYSPRLSKLLTTWRVGIPIGIGAGWLSTSILIIFVCAGSGNLAPIFNKFWQWLLVPFYGSLYGIIGAGHVILSNKKKEAEQAMALNRS